VAAEGDALDFGDPHPSALIVVPPSRRSREKIRGGAQGGTFLRFATGPRLWYPLHDGRLSGA
jgi:hypothetical protein